MAPIELPNLTYITILRCNLTFDEFQMFITPISSNVRLLRINTSKDSAYLDADRWKKLILQHMPQLSKFDFQYYEYVDTVFESKPYHALINRFASQFWIERRWFLEIDITPYFPNRSACITISIHPFMYRATWYELQEHLENKTYYNQSAKWKTIDHATMPRQTKVTNSWIECSQATPLIVIGNSCYGSYHNGTAERNQSFIDHMRPSFTMVHITHLEVRFEEIFADKFIEFLRLFSDLDSLKISCQLPQPLNGLSVQDSEIFRSVKNNNKITKLSLWWMIKIEHACFLVDLFPLIKYLEVYCTNFINLELFLRHILPIKTKSIRHLSSMCLCFERTDDGLVKNLQKLIEEEKILDDYVIKCINQQGIYLQWKWHQSLFFFI